MSKPKYKSLTGMHDLMEPEIAKWQFIEKTAREIFSNYNFEEIRTPLLESTDLFIRSIGENTGVVSKEMYSFEDKGGDLITLRPEGTASVVRAATQINLYRHQPQAKLYYMGPMFRYERPQKGRLRQFHQIGAEIFGPSSAHADIEIIASADDIFKKLGIKDYKLQINSLGLMSERQKYLEELIKYLSQYQSEFGEEDQSRLKTNPLRVLDSKEEKIQTILDDAPQIIDFLEEESKNHWDEVLSGLDDLNIDYIINPRIVRGLDYYVRTAFEFTSDQLGSQSAFAGGGRYDGLVEEMGGPQTSSVGFALGVERLAMLLNDFSLNEISFYMAYSEKTKSKAYQICHNLRSSGFKIHFSLDQKSLKSQLKQADKNNCNFVLILGEDELIQNSILLKNLSSGEQISLSQTEILSHLKKL